MVKYYDVRDGPPILFNIPKKKTARYKFNIPIIKTINYRYIP